MTDHEPTADVVPIDAARERRAAAEDRPVEGVVVRVDRPDADGPDWLTALAERSKDRRPIVPSWMRSGPERTATIKWVAAHYTYVAGYHVTRSPKYAGRLAMRAPVGLARVVNSSLSWTFDLEGRPVRLDAVRRADAEAYLKLSRQRDARVRLRVVIALLALGVVVPAGLVVAFAPPGAQLCALVVLVVVLGVAGRPADRPLIDRAVVPTAHEKLSSDIVIRALGALGVPAINQALARGGSGINFVAPITRDGGTGYRADLDLPYGVTVAEVMDRREKLASGLRRPLGCVWPEAVPDQHTGRMVLFVGDQDMNKAKQPAWPLLKSGAVDLFKAQPFGTDQRGRFASITLMFVSVIIGSIPRMGKTFLLRLLCLIAALDPRAELHLYDLKGTGDLSPLESVAHRYRAGEEDEDIAYAISDMRALKEELRRRAKVIRNLPKDVCPESKVTPELASNKSLGLHPIVIAVDECQVWFEHAKYGDEFESICTDLVKRGPALGIVLIVATQRPDAKSLPTGISANAVLRLCLKVMGHTENDMVLGTSAHKNGIRATMFSFSDKGICYYAGEGDAPRITKSVYIDAPAAEKIALKARALRVHAGTLSGHALGDQFEADTAPAYDLLADILGVVGEPKVWNEVVVSRLAELRPTIYGPWADLEPEARAAQLTTALKPYGVRTGQVWGNTEDGRGANRRGITRDEVAKAFADRSSDAS
ncbi:cell division protein FtsK [Herbidospora cretacea]|uniref:cell division protein FtsK n=1 Tax=Herbidospora cretacea TaxID=28444 RepID=UPI0007743317|nr:cell division protein FtsK [Herbidospora cretacea]